MQAQLFDSSIEFLFIDGGSTDDSRELLDTMGKEDPRIRVLDNPDRQTARALNIGLEASRGEYVVRMDAHTFYPPRYIAAGVERLGKGDVVWVCGAQLAAGEGKWSTRVALALNTPLGTGPSRRFSRKGDWGEETELDTGVFTGVWRRSTLETHGGWDARWPINQDSELAARIIEAGGRIVSIPALDAWYIPRDSPRGLARQYLRYGYYRAKTSREHPASMRLGHLFPPALVGALLAAPVGPRLPSRPARVALLFYLAAVAKAAGRATGRAQTVETVALLGVFATMHLTWGVGFLGGSLRFAFGVPEASDTDKAKPEGGPGGSSG
jgi:glycosyltransferase involved in cell wall biosynthesis